jgi:hypothetical protein
MTGNKLSIFKWTSLSLGVASIFFSAFLALTPSVGAFGGSGATCPGGGEVNCSGVSCSSTTTSCTCTDGHGHITDQHKCPKVAMLMDEISVAENLY